MTRLKNAKAFTLIELIVVIVIIGILVAIAAVAYNSIIANSKKSALEASASQLAKIIQAESASTQTLATDKTTPAATEFDALSAAMKTKYTGDGVKLDAVTGVANDNKIEVTAPGTTTPKVVIDLSTTVGGANAVAKATP